MLIMKKSAFAQTCGFSRNIRQVWVRVTDAMFPHVHIVYQNFCELSENFYQNKIAQTHITPEMCWLALL